MRQISKYVLLLTAFSMANVYATSGNFSYGYDIIGQGMGGAGSAYPQSPLVSAVNPAGLVYLDSQQLDVGVDVLSPIRSYNATEGNGGFPVLPGYVGSGTNAYIIPSFGYSRPVANNKGALGVSVYANGLGTDYNQSVYGGGETGLLLMQIFTNFSGAWKITDNFSAGAGLIVVNQLLNIKGLDNFKPFSVSPDNLTNTGTDSSIGAGVNFGLMYHVLPTVSMALSYQPEISMSKFDDYSGLLPDNGSLNVPATGTLGLAWNISPKVVGTVDWQRIWFGSVPGYGNSNTCVSTSPCLGTSDGAGFGWTNTNVYKLGLQWMYNPDWTYRFGYAYSTQPVDPDDVLFDIIAPAVTQQHFTAGFSHKLTKTLALNGSFMVSPTTSVSGLNPFSPGQSIELSMHQYEVGLGITWKPL